MTCAQTRRLIAAYRRDDWSPDELAMFGAHVAGCAECRRIEAAFRTVGESVRQLPSITPPESLRTRVFAAIREESTSRAPVLARMTSDETQPKLPVVRGRAAGPARRQFVLGTPAAIAVAAVLLLSLVGARLVPVIAHGLPSIAASLSNIAPNSVTSASAPHVAHYTAPSGSGPIASALASAHWVVYAAGTSDHLAVYATNRATHKTTVLRQAQPGTVTMLGLSDSWALWLASESGAADAWALWASPLSGGSAAASPQALALATSSDAAAAAPWLLDGASIQSNSVLAAMVTRSGETHIVRFDLAPARASVTSHVVASGSAGHVFSDPAFASNQYYWADAWADGYGVLHSDIWRGDDAGHVTAVTTGGTAFAPRMAGRSLVLIQSSGQILLDPAALAAQPDRAIQDTLQQVGGALDTQSLTAGQMQQISAHALADSLAASNSLIVWRDGGQVHTFDLGRHAASAVEHDVCGAAFAAATSSSLAWSQPNSTTINVYDHA